MVPRPHAGGSWATTCWKKFREPVAVEEIRAHAGIDIGGTLIGMHLKRVAVPVRLSLSKLVKRTFCAPAPPEAHRRRTRQVYRGGLSIMAEKNLEQMQEAVAEIREKMAAAAREAGRDPAAVQLCAACKTRTAQTVAASAALPIDVFGENHVQELCANLTQVLTAASPATLSAICRRTKLKKCWAVPASSRAWTVSIC